MRNTQSELIDGMKLEKHNMCNEGLYDAVPLSYEKCKIVILMCVCVCSNLHQERDLNII